MLGTLKVVGQGVKGRRPVQRRRDAGLLLKRKGCTGQKGKVVERSHCCFLCCRFFVYVSVDLLTDLW